MDAVKALSALAPSAHPDAIQTAGALWISSVFHWPQYEIQVDDEKKPQIFILTPKDNKAAFMNRYCIIHATVDSDLNKIDVDWSDGTRVAGLHLWTKSFFLDSIYAQRPAGGRGHSVDIDDYDSSIFIFAKADIAAIKRERRPLPQADLSVDSLTEEDTTTVLDTWPYGSYYSDVAKGQFDFILEHIRHYPSVCLRKQGIPIAWIMLNHYGALGFLYVDPPHRKQGLAIFVIKELLLRFEQFDFIPYVQIELSNEPSRRLFEKSGFIRMAQADCTWLHVHARSNT